MAYNKAQTMCTITGTGEAVMRGVGGQQVGTARQLDQT
jgi:hypothetical protein